MDTASISRNVVVDVPIVADANVALDKLNEWAEPIKTAEWQKQIKAWDEENPLGMRDVYKRQISHGIKEQSDEQSNCNRGVFRHRKSYMQAACSEWLAGLRNRKKL